METICGEFSSLFTSRFLWEARSFMKQGLMKPVCMNLHKDPLPSLLCERQLWLRDSQGTVSWASLPRFALRTPDELLPCHRVSILSFPCLLLHSGAKVTRNRGAWEPRLGGSAITAHSQGWTPALGATGDLYIFTVVSDASSPPLCSWNVQTPPGRRSKWSLTVFWERKEGAVVQMCISEGGLCAQKLSCLQKPGHQISASGLRVGWG